MADALIPPAAETRPIIVTTHGDERVDEYAWLSDRDDPDTIAYLEAENAYTEATLSHLSELRSSLFDEMKARIVETDLSVPTRRGPWWYYARTVEGMSYPIHCRRPVSDPGEVPPMDADAGDQEQILYDENIEAADHEFFSVGILAVSPDHSTLAYATDTVGNERFELRFRRLDGRVDPTESISDVSYGFAWAGDSETAFYTRVDDAWRPHQLWRHRVADAPENDELVIEEDDARFNVGVSRSRDDAAIVVTIGSSTTTETHAIDAKDPTAPLALIAPRESGVEHGIEHLELHDGSAWWLMVTNRDGALDFEIQVAPDDGSASPRFVPLISHRPGTRIEGIDAFSSWLVISERIEAETQLRIIPLDGGFPGPPDALLERSWLVDSGTSPSTTWLGANPEHDTQTLRFGHTSLITPSTVAQIDLTDRSTVVLKQQEVLGGYNPEDYVTAREWATALDGEKIPISIVRARTSPLGDTGPAPCLLYGYGSYEISIDPSFSAIRLSLLDRGVVFAIAHVRGGGELGRRWYDDGHLQAKHNTFDDFVAVADHLIATGLTAPDRLAARGGSAGGLLMGAVANRAPDRFCALLGEVPFVDALNTMLDPTLPLTVGEYEEWGNPTDDAEAYATIKSYAPYENVVVTNADGSPHRYPSLLLTGGLNDTRVGFWEPAKFTARLRAANRSNPVLLRTEMGVGHGGPSGRYDSWREEAFVMAWLLEQLGLGAVVPRQRPSAS